jgi:hypothetical protein
MTLTPQIDVDILRLQEFSLNLRHEPFDFKRAGPGIFVVTIIFFPVVLIKEKKIKSATSYQVRLLFSQNWDTKLFKKK